ncbi:FecR family protein [Maribellus sp. CM-23]|uniref:FecR family protein n=1 Tax=Maribellus sp. CM-23 TaxID=2781026 RepID=UPI001F45C745|nr:FecR family protein [Maribellus sp. CM-23]MCE4565882.1 FecR family protein [Maribellus sp. CM-23]
MKKQNEIIELFEKLISNQATSKEKEELFQLVYNENNKEIVFKWLEENWNTVEYDELNISSKALLNEIHDIIGTENTTRSEKKQGIKLRRTIITTMKYAAAFIVAWLIQWFIYTQPESNVDIAQVSQEVHYNEVNVPIGSKSYIILADSTKIWLNAGATLKYPTNFQENQREVFLTGEAFFDVAKDKQKPFFVNTNGMNIKVLGTQFNVKAYGDENSIETTLIEGAIEILGLKSDQEDESNLVLKPGQKLVLLKDKSVHEVLDATEENSDEKSENKAIPSIRIKQAQVITLQDTEPEVSWKEDKLIFNKEPFRDVKIMLERWYGVNIIVKDSEILDYRFTGTFDKETFDQAMFALQQAARFDYSIKKKTVTIKRN